ncbi:MAG TPA: thiamine-phosphate kinase [Acidimicrobiales bacterium]|nr:thiamine-phosphate kinase [Acidimicrobiales bacterium]
MHPPNAEDTGGGVGATPGEFAAIARIARRLPGPPPGELWLGDDAAVLRPGHGSLVLSTDLAVAGVHGDLALIGLDDFGWRAFAGAVSDLAAMGADPWRATVAVAGPPSTDLDLLYEGLAGCAEAHACPIVGGDLAGSGPAGGLVVAVTVTGLVPEGPPPVRRSGAGAGDALFVTGPLGGSAAGLRLLRAGPGGPGPTPGPGAVNLVDLHRRPRARLAEGRCARLAGASAMVDVSDGLAADLGHLALASGVGVAVDEVPCAPGATQEEALGGGEDYQLVVATGDPGRLLEAFDEAGLEVPVRIGSCVADPGVRTLAGDPMPEAGWEHPFG